jgi:hypothetical protein
LRKFSISVRRVGRVNERVETYFAALPDFESHLEQFGSHLGQPFREDNDSVVNNGSDLFAS